MVNEQNELALPVGAQKEEIEFADFLRVDIRVGTVLAARANPKARQPALILEIDFGELGIKTTSAQITQNYAPDALVGMQVTAIVNFGAKRVAGIKSEVLVLAAVCEQSGTVLLSPTTTVRNGSPVA